MDFSESLMTGEVKNIEMTLNVCMRPQYFTADFVTLTDKEELFHHS
jgi:hypothetical protein